MDRLTWVMVLFVCVAIVVTGHMKNAEADDPIKWSQPEYEPEPRNAEYYLKKIMEYEKKQLAELKKIRKAVEKQ